MKESQHSRHYKLTTTKTKGYRGGSRRSRRGRGIVVCRRAAGHVHRVRRRARMVGGNAQLVGYGNFLVSMLEGRDKGM